MKHEITKFIVLIPCAGIGSRFGGNIPKQYLKIGAKTVLERTLDAFLSIPLITQIVVVVNPDDKYIDQFSNLSTKVVIHRVGADTRAKSVLNGLLQLKCEANDWVLVHDAVRCCIASELITSMILKLEKDDVGGILAIPATDTLKFCHNGVIKKTLERDDIYLAQTPQMFRYHVLLKALKSVKLDQITDESSAVEKLGLQVQMVAGDVNNIKITHPRDVEFVKLLLLK